MNHIINENFSFSKWIGPFQKGQLLAFSEMEHFRIFFYSEYIYCSLEVDSLSFVLIILKDFQLSYREIDKQLDLNFSSVIT